MLLMYASIGRAAMVRAGSPTIIVVSVKICTHMGHVMVVVRPRHHRLASRSRPRSDALWHSGKTCQLCLSVLDRAFTRRVVLKEPYDSWRFTHVPTLM